MPDDNNQQPSGQQAQNTYTRDTTTQQPAQPSAQTPQQTSSAPNPESPIASSMSTAPKKGMKIGAVTIGAIVLLIVIIAVGAYFLVNHTSSPSSSTTISPTTSVKSTAQLTSCTTITSPGHYELGGNIYLSASASCIVIKSSDVQLVGNNYTIHGVGPYYSVPPFTYGIDVVDVNNVSITGLRVANFSYGIYLNGSSNVDISNNNASADVVSGIYLLNSYHNTIHDNQIFFVPDGGGALFLNASYFNDISNNLVDTNGNIGVFVNGTDNTFENNTVSNNPIDLKCSPIAGSSQTNVFESNVCSTNQYCDFAQCSLNNIPLNLSMIHLSQGITSCGGIYAPGNYSLENDLYASSYLNTSNPAAKTEACITILAPQVNIDCKGYTIGGAGTGIAVDNLDANITDCNIENNTYGIYANNQLNVDVHNTTISNGKYGLYLNLITSGNITNVATNAESYGVDINNSTGVFFDALNSTGNTYGAYVQNNPENTFIDSNLRGNSNEDLFCNVNSYMSTAPIFQNNQCGVTDCRWAESSCSTLVPPPLPNIPISACESITSPGNYTVIGSIAQTSTCISIEASNVTLSCDGHYISGGHSGSAIEVLGHSNVSIESCSVDRFFDGISVVNSSDVSITNVNAPGDNQGIDVSGSSGVRVYNVSVSNLTGSYGIELSGSSASSVKDVNVSGVPSGSAGFILTKATDNVLTNDTVKSSGGYGFSLINSVNNTILNTSSYGSQIDDYYCSGTSTGIYAESGTGINYGNTKSGCAWLVELNTLAPQQCYLVGGSSTVTLSGDMLYPYGSTCYVVEKSSASGSANGTVINCNYHTVLATNGGTFADIINSSGVIIKNCYLKGFTTPIVVSGIKSELSGTITNDTIVSSKTAISTNSTFGYAITNDIILNATDYGILFKNGKYAKISKDTIGDASSCIYVLNGTEDQLDDNTCSGGSYGISLVNNTFGGFKNNTVESTTAGFFCGVNSNTTTSELQDLGGNVCSSNDDCLWMTSSQECKPTT